MSTSKQTKFTKTNYVSSNYELMKAQKSGKMIQMTSQIIMTLPALVPAVLDIVVAMDKCL